MEGRREGKEKEEKTGGKERGKNTKEYKSTHNNTKEEQTATNILVLTKLFEINYTSKSKAKAKAPPHPSLQLSLAGNENIEKKTCSMKRTCLNGIFSIEIRLRLSLLLLIVMKCGARPLEKF